MGPRRVCRLDGIEAAYCMLVDGLGRPMEDLNWKGCLLQTHPRDRIFRVAEAAWRIILSFTSRSVIYQERQALGSGFQR
jgi:hypothetical protein